MLYCGFPSHPLKIMFFARWESIECFCLNFLHASRQMKPDRHPSQITSRRVSAAHQEGVGAPTELTMFHDCRGFHRTKCVEHKKLRRV